MRSAKLLTFVMTVAGLGLVVFVSLAPTGVLDRPGFLLLLAALTVVAGVRPVRIASLGIEMTPTHPFILVGVVTLGPMAAALISIAGVLGAAIGRAGWPAVLRFTFNLGTAVLSTALASSVYRLLAGGASLSYSAIVLPLAAATAGYFLANTGLVAAAIALERSQGFFATWRRTFLWTPVSYLAGYAVAVVLLAGGDSVVVWSCVLGLPPCWLLVMFYRQHALGATGIRVAGQRH